MIMITVEANTHKVTHLFISSSDELVNEALAVKSGKTPGLKGTDEFKRLLQPAPPEQIADVRAFFGIPEDYALRVPTGEAQPLTDLIHLLDGFTAH